MLETTEKWVSLRLNHADHLDAMAAEEARHDSGREKFLALEAGAAALREHDKLRASNAAKEDWLRAWISYANSGHYNASLKNRFARDVESRFLSGQFDSLKWLDAREAAMTAHCERLRAALEVMLKSAWPHPVEHPTMTAAWAIGKQALAETPAGSLTAEAVVKLGAEALELLAWADSEFSGFVRGTGIAKWTIEAPTEAHCTLIDAIRAARKAADDD